MRRWTCFDRSTSVHREWRFDKRYLCFRGPLFPGMFLVVLLCYFSNLNSIALKGRGGLHISPLDPQFSAFSIWLQIFWQILFVSKLFSSNWVKKSRFSVWNVSFTTSDFNTQTELESKMGILHCKRHWKYPDDNVLQVLHVRGAPYQTLVICIYIHGPVNL